MTLIPLPDALDKVLMCGSGISGDKLNKFEKFQLYSDATFTLINVVTASLIGLGMMIIRHSDTIPLRMVNMTKHCNDSMYNMKLIQPPNKVFLYLSIILMFLIVFIATVSKTFIMTQNKIKAFKKIIKEIFSFGLQFFFFCVMMELIKLITGIPSPDYFSHEELQDYYCSDSFTMNKTQSEEIQALDKSLRTSFPSYRAAMFSYCTTFLYLFVDHMDILNGLHTTQQLILFLFGCFSTHRLINHIEFGENHVEDVIGGVMIGFFYAIVTIRNLFGTVLYKRTHPWILEEKQHKDKSEKNQVEDPESLINLSNDDLSDLPNIQTFRNDQPINLNEILVTVPLNPVRNNGLSRVSSVTRNLSTIYL